MIKHFSHHSNIHIVCAYRAEIYDKHQSVRFKTDPEIFGCK